MVCSQPTLASSTITPVENCNCGVVMKVRSLFCFAAQKCCQHCRVAVACADLHAWAFKLLPHDTRAKSGLRQDDRDEAAEWISVFALCNIFVPIRAIRGVDHQARNVPEWIPATNGRVIIYGRRQEQTAGEIPVTACGFKMTRMTRTRWPSDGSSVMQ